MSVPIRVVASRVIGDIEIWGTSPLNLLVYLLVLVVVVGLIVYVVKRLFP